MGRPAAAVLDRVLADSCENDCRRNHPNPKMRSTISVKDGADLARRKPTPAAYPLMDRGAELEFVHRDARRIDALFAEIMRLAHDDPEMPKEPVYRSSLIASALLVLGSAVNGVNIRVEVDDGISALASCVNLERVVINLIDNALYAARTDHAHAAIRVQVALVDGATMLTLTDQGGFICVASSTSEATTFRAVFPTKNAYPTGRSGGLHVERAEVIALADADAVVPENRVGLREVEEEVRQGVLEEIVGAGHHLALPSGLRDDARRGVGEVLSGEPVEVSDGRAHASAEVAEGLLGVRTFRGLLAGEPRGPELRRVARALHLPSKRKLVGCQSKPEKEIGVEGLLLSARRGQIEPLIHLAEHLLHLLKHLEVHGRGH